MKTITQGYKENVKLFGREIDSKITYIVGSEEIELGAEELNSITPHYEGGILKSVMKQLDIDSNEDIPVGTEINYQFGVKVNNNFEYIDFGNYIVYSSEKQEDVGSYKIICYDKMLKSMIPYEDMNITYPITINNYIKTICTHLNLTFANDGEQFVNYNKQIQQELYLDNGGNSLNYTFRDVLDELAEVTASTICINENTDELEIRYITSTNDTINEEYLKDINVNFGEKYGPVNSIVLSRSAESDNVYLQDDVSVAQNGLCEIKIIDNQIMNWNDRANYLPDILGALDGLEYYLNDFSSTGITYYDLCDRYTVNIGGNNYNCIMFNNEINVTQGLDEYVYTRKPKESTTDYTKSDKTDQKINQTYLIVDKQNQKISSVVSTVTQQGSQISTITQTVDGISTEVSNKVGNNEVISKINQTPEQITINASKVNLQGYVTATDLSSTGTTTINGSNITTGTIDASQVNVTNIDADNITSGTISASKVNGGVLSGQTISGGLIELTSNYSNPKLVLDGKSFGNIDSTNEVVADGLRVISDNEELINLRTEKITSGSTTGYDGALWLKNTLNSNSVYLTPDNLSFINGNTNNIHMYVDSVGGHIECNDFLSQNHASTYDQYLFVQNGAISATIIPKSSSEDIRGVTIDGSRMFFYHSSNNTLINADNGVIHTSKEEYKKNIELRNNNLDLVKKADVYNFLYKSEDDSNKPHIGLVIGKKYNTPNEIISENGDGIVLYDMCGVMWGAIKEQQEIIEKLEKRIEKLEKEK